NSFKTKDFIGFFGDYLDEVQAAVVGDESCDFLAVLNELDPDAFPDGRVGLLGFHPPHPHFLQDDALGVGSSPEGVGLQRRAQMRLLVLLIVPFLVPAVAAQLPSGAEASALPCRTRREGGKPWDIPWDPSDFWSTHLPFYPNFPLSFPIAEVLEVPEVPLQCTTLPFNFYFLLNAWFSSIAALISQYPI
uniref:Uncharacterized protein n=1 Tax=Catharus ustulatus TaxID=91951 RepID=A0A8C3UU27_CATUS